VRYWIKAVLSVIIVTVVVSSGLDGMIHYIGSVNSANDFSYYASNVTEPLGILIASFIVLRFKPVNDADRLHYNLIKKILMVILPISAFYGIGNEFLRAYGPYVSPFLIIFVFYTKHIAMLLAIALVYQKFKSSRLDGTS